MAKRARPEEESAEATSEEVEYSEAIVPEGRTAVVEVDLVPVGRTANKGEAGPQRKCYRATWPRTGCRGKVPFGSCWLWQVTSRGDSHGPLSHVGS